MNQKEIDNQGIINEKVKIKGLNLLRLQKNISQAELANRLQKVQQEISDFERFKRMSLPPEIIQKICDFFKVNEQEITKEIWIDKTELDQLRHNASKKRHTPKKCQLNIEELRKKNPFTCKQRD